MRLMKKGIAIALAATMVVSLAPYNGADAAKKPALNRKNANVNVGGSLKLKVKNGKKKATVVWKTSNKKVAKITKKTTKGNATATIKGVKSGKATITATYKFGKKNTKLKCTVTVKQKQAVTTQAPNNNVATNPVVTTLPPTTNPVPPQLTAPVPTKAPTAVPTKRPTPKPTPSADAQIYKTTTDIAVDGTIDKAWGFVMSIPIKNWKAVDDNEAKTSNASAKIMWTKETKKLYVLVEAEDSSIDPEKDSVDLFVDEYNNKEEWGSEKKKNEFQYRTMIDEKADKPGSFTEKNQWDGGEIETAVVKTAKGYIVEFAVPLHEAPVEEGYIGVEIQINDASDGKINGTWNLFANPSAGDKTPEESTLVFGECQYAIMRKEREISLDFSDPDSTDMQLPDQFSVKDDNNNVLYFADDGETILSRQYIEEDAEGNVVINYRDEDGKSLIAPIGNKKPIQNETQDYGMMNTKARYDSENGLVYCETANNIVVYFPGGTKIFNGEKAAIKIEGKYTVSAPDAGDSGEEDTPVEDFEMSDTDTVFRTWLVDTDNKVLKGDSPVTTSEQIHVTYGDVKVTDENGTFKFRCDVRASEGDKPSDLNGYVSDGTCDALMIKAPTYSSTIGNLVLSKVTLVVFDEVKNDDTEPTAVTEE